MMLIARCKEMIWIVQRDSIALSGLYHTTLPLYLICNKYIIKLYSYTFQH